ncbi:hypothetical protein BD413DRAFT_157520 [Trametes elegans]|nr:hypothetical protein BD413DRAFT_157520 [Trametes elegans]
MPKGAATRSGQLGTSFNSTSKRTATGTNGPAADLAKGAHSTDPNRPVASSHPKPEGHNTHDTTSGSPANSH